MTVEQLINRGYVPGGDPSKLSTMGNTFVNFCKGNIVVRYGLNYLPKGAKHAPPSIETIINKRSGKFIETAFNKIVRDAIKKNNPS